MLKFGNTYLNFGGTYLSGFEDPYNPLNLPSNTVRVRTNDGNAPNIFGETSYETATLVPGTNDVYDVYKSGTSFSNLFYQSTNVIEVLGANTTGITNMHAMFEFCSALTNVPLFYTSSVTRMDGMFKHCSSLTSIPLFDTSSVTLMASMFYGCSSLITVPLFNTSKVTNTVGMFEDCSALTNVPLFDTSSVTNMGDMFRYCSSLTSIPLFDTSSVTLMRGMFGHCSSLTSIPLFDTSSVTIMSYMFYNCINVESGALELYKQASSHTTPPSEHTEVFYNCGSNTQTGSSELAQIPDDWK